MDLEQADSNIKEFKEAFPDVEKPGKSAITNLLWSFNMTTPRLGERVVKW